MTKKWSNWIEERPLGSTSGQGDTFLVYKEGDADRSLFVLKHIKGKGPFGNRVERFRNEIESGIRLVHANVTGVVDSELNWQKPFIVTEYCVGGALSPLALRGLTLLERLELFRGICTGVAYAHSKGVVHRDLKPDNIFLREDGTPVVGDFGLCYFLEEEEGRVTNIAEAVGARGYMAPECEGGRQDAVHRSSDVYSLGKILYWMLTCRNFHRERHQSPENDLACDPSDFEMQMVYELLDKTVVESVSQRLPDASAVITALDSIVRRINTRKRLIDLARQPLSMPDRQKVKIASFRLGGLPKWQSFDPGPATVLGFAGNGQLLAAWGIEKRGEGETACRAWIAGPHGDWQVKYIEVSEPCVPQAASHQALFVNRQDAHLLVVGAQGGGEIRRAYLARIPVVGAVTVEALADNVAAPRHCALAVGPSPFDAAYLGPWEDRRDGRSGTFIRDPEGGSLRLISPRTDFPGPLAFDKTGTLHQAIVHESQGRELRYLSKRPGEPWAEAVVERVAEGLMSAHISLAVSPNGQPAILYSSRDARSLVVHAKKLSQNRP